MLKWISLITLSFFSLTSCCTLKRNPEQPIKITANIPEAEILVDGNPSGKTPKIIKVNPNSFHHIVVQKEGYEPKSYSLPSHVSPIKLGSNLIFPVAGSVIGAGVGLILTGGATGGFDGLAIFLTTAAGLATGIVFGVLGAGVDLFSGNARKFSTNHIHSHLIEVESKDVEIRE